MSDILRGAICEAISNSTVISSRSNTLAASFGFMPSYMVMMPLKRAASISLLAPLAVEILLSTAFISSTLDSMRFSADFSRLSRMSISRARASSSCRRDCSRSRIARSDADTGAVCSG